MRLSRTQLALGLAWAVTVHKGQGLTLGKVVIDLFAPEFSPGIAYVAISRVKTLSGLMFKHNFLHSRLQRPNATATMGYLATDNEWRRGLAMTNYQDYHVDMTEYEDEFVNE